MRSRLASAAVCAVAAFASFSAVAAANTVGAWLSPTDDNWPLIPIHATLTPDGRVLTYGTDGTGKQTGYFIYDVWDPAQGLSAGHLTLDNFTQTDLFCSSLIVLPQSGSVLIAGGDNWTGTATTNTGNNNANLFRFGDNTLSRTGDMNRPRWYASSTVLPNGEIYVQGGTGGTDRPEVRGLDGAFRILDGVDTSGLSYYYPRNFVAPDGRIFGYDASGTMYYVSETGTGALLPAGNLPWNIGVTVSEAMFSPGRILHIGGNSSAATLININGPQPVVTATQPLSSQRQWVSATVLADGRVLATGGSSIDNELTGVNNAAEIWDPSSGTWTVGPSGGRARLYHSIALLLPDASVLVAGGGAPGPLVNRHAEIYYPSYLFNAAGGFAARPAIDAAPDSVDVGQTFSVGVGSTDIRRVTLVKTGSVTHSRNMDQRFMELPFTASSGTLFVQAPMNVADAPPGYYMLFVFNESGVPSVGRILRLNIPTVTGISLDYTPWIGTLGSNMQFQLSCNSDETLVGVYGNSAGTYVNRVGAQCVVIDRDGRWVGEPVNRGSSGTESGNAYTRTCARDSAISGFRGRGAMFVDQLDFECRAVSQSGKLTGEGVFLGPVGGTGGTPQGPYRCSSDNPAYRLVGRSGGWLDAFGMECRTSPSGSGGGGNTPPVVANPGAQSTTVNSSVSLQVVASDADNDALSYSATGLPAGLAISPTSGLVSGVATTADTSSVTVSVTDGTAITSVSFAWSVGALNPLALDPMPDQPARQTGTAITYTATSRNGVNARYKWYFDDGTETGWLTSPSVTHTYDRSTIYWVSVTVTDDRGIQQTQTFSQLVYLPPTTARPTNSSNVGLNGGKLWVANPDADTISVFATSSNQKLAEVAVGKAPRSIGFAADGSAWVTNEQSSTISIVSPVTLAVSQTIALPYASRPYGIAFSPDGAFAYVALAASGRVLKIDATTRSVLFNVGVGANPRHVAVNAAGSRLLVSRFISPPLPGEATATVTTSVSGVQKGGEVVVLSTDTMTVARTMVLQHSDDMDFENSGSGVPNYLGPVVISPDGGSGWVPSKKDNVKRGTLRSGLNLNFQNTVRAISSRVDLVTEAETYAARIDHDNASLASAAAFERYGVFLFVALETSREVAVVDAQNSIEFFRIPVGRAPQGLAVSPDGYRLYVHNFMDRTVGVYDLTKLIDRGQAQVPLVATLQSVATEKLAANVLKGKQLFYDAFDVRLARDRYLSCASCHSDGGADGRVWDMTGFGEGLRNTVVLNGRAGGQGFLHWSGNFDEVQDFEGQIRTLAGGTGLMTDTAYATGTRSQPLGDAKAGLSADLDALAAYVASLNTFALSPNRNSNGTLTSSGASGKTLFQSLNCAQCHGGSGFTLSAAGNLKDVGTLKQPTSGKRLGGTLTGIDIPTLRDAWSSAPYLHDGSASSIEAAIAAHQGVSLKAADLTKLANYVRQIDGQEPAFTANTSPVVQNPGNQAGRVGVVASLQIQAADPDGDTLSYGASGLPSGLRINSSTGLISGTPTKATNATVTVTVTDSKGAASKITFAWAISR